MLDYRSTIAAAACMGALLVGCTDPDLPTDLRTSGPPDITTVTVLSDLETAIDPAPLGLGRIVESATFCRLNDPKRPSLVGLPDIRVIQVCPDDLNKPADDNGAAQAVPPQWFVRVVFDELLDPTIEDLVPQLDSKGNPTGVTVGTLKNTQPVTLKCNNADVPYDGYYVPNGNRQSWPLGPALFIQPLSATSVPTDASCTVGLRDTIHNKSGQSVPTDQRQFTFKLAPMQFRFSSPDPSEADKSGAVEIGLKTPIDLFWTAALKAGPVLMTGTDKITPSTLDPTKVIITSGPNNPDGSANSDVCGGTGGTPVDPLTIRAFLRGTTATTTALVLRIDIGGPTAAPFTGWAPDTTYNLTFADGAAVTPAQGGPDGPLPGASDYSLCFHTPAA